jgi:hypothetical protein
MGNQGRDGHDRQRRRLIGTRGERNDGKTKQNQRQQHGNDRLRLGSGRQDPSENGTDGYP